MNRRQSTGRISIVGVGPGDPGLLTQRALSAIGIADVLLCDSSLPPALVNAIRDNMPEESDQKIAEDDPEETAKQLIAEANNSRHAVHCVHGDVLSGSSAMKEINTIAQSGISFEVLPGVGHALGVTTYAGIPLGSMRTLIDVADPAIVDFSALANFPGSLAITLDASLLPAVRDNLMAAGRDAATQVAITNNGTTEIQSTHITTLQSVADEALGWRGPLVLTMGAGVTHSESLGWWEQRALYGWKVLVPRTKEQAGAMSAKLRVYGAIPTEVPTIAVEPPRTPAQMERAIKGLVDGRYAWVVFTSANAVKAVWEKFGEHGLDARSFGGVKIACIGDVTADAVRGFGVEPELLPTGEQSSDGLLEDFPPYDKTFDPIDRIFLPRADIATERLAEGLVQRGWEVDDITAYRTVRASPPPADIRDAIKGGGFDAVLFTSSSTVKNLVGIAGKPHARTVIACIGPATAATARDVGLEVHVQPEVANVSSLIEATAQYALELREKNAKAKTPRRRGAKVQGPTALMGV